MNPAVESAHRKIERAPCIPDIVQEHVEELAFLSLQRRKLLFAEDVTPRGLSRHDARIVAHWAALEIQPVDAVRIAKERMPDAASAWDVMACIRTWVQLGEPTPDEIFEACEAADDEASAGWREAFRRMPRDVVVKRLPPVDAASSSPRAEGILADAFAWHGLLSPRQIAAASRSPHAGVRRAVARHADSMEVLAPLQSDGDPDVRCAAFWSAALLDFGRALDEARRLAAREAPDPFAALLISVFGTPDETGIRKRSERDAAAPEPVMAKLWRRAVRSGEDPFGIRREVPDGFFTGTLADEAIPGE
jgi:hypothetical protein